MLRFLWQGGEGELLEGALGGALGEHTVEAAGEGADGHLGGEQLGAAGAHLGKRLARRPGVEGVAQPGGVDAQLDGLAFGRATGADSTTMSTTRRRSTAQSWPSRRVTNKS